VIASFPDQARVAVFGAEGQELQEVPLPAGTSPVGVAVAPDGRILVADARGNVVDSLPIS
jgi:streptogramin lyase